MLVEILNLLAVGVALPISKLARELSVSEELVLQMLTDLTQRGYLRLLDTVCQSGCSTCPMANTRAARSAGKTWVLTQKGARLITSFARTTR